MSYDSKGERNQRRDLPVQSGTERRQVPRRPYRGVQRIAACDNGNQPPADAFHVVQCNDISTGGISFFYPVAPPFKKLVIELGAPPIYMFAEIVYLLERPHRPRLVGCEFKGQSSLTPT